MAGHEESNRANGQGARVRPSNRRVAQWTRDYARLPGIPDEYIGQDGAPRARILGRWTSSFIFVKVGTRLRPSDSAAPV